jgi:hypothetical protein
MKEIKQNPSFLKFKRFLSKHNLKIAMEERRFGKVWWKEERNENKLNPNYTISLRVMEEPTLIKNPWGKRFDKLVR